MANMTRILFSKKIVNVKNVSLLSAICHSFIIIPGSFYWFLFFLSLILGFPEDLAETQEN